MTHEKFIELLNLYLDGDLPPADASALEHELRGNVERRRIYRQYCQMQRACTDLAERFREEASPAAQFRSGAVVEIPRRASGEWFRSIALVASGALAACAVFVVVRTAVPGKASQAIAQDVPAPVSVATVAAPRTVADTTAVALNNPAVFSNPWANGQRPVQRMVAFNQLAPTDRLLLLSVPELKMPPGTEQLPADLQPYGTAPAPTIRMEDIEANAFQFPR